MKIANLFFTLICICLSKSSFGKDLDSSQKTVGLIELPKIFGLKDPKGLPGQVAPKSPRTLSLYESPSLKAKVIKQFSESTDVKAMEHAYEEKSVPAYARKGQWFLIQVKDIKGWISPSDVGTFHSYKDLVSGSLTYLNGNWTGKMFEAPGDTKMAFSPEKSSRTKNDLYPPNLLNPQLDVKVLSSKVIDSELWLELQIIKGRCDGDEILGRKGWVQAYSANGEPTVWFYSRGC